MNKAEQNENVNEKNIFKYKITVTNHNTSIVDEFRVLNDEVVIWIGDVHSSEGRTFNGDARHHRRTSSNNVKWGISLTEAISTGVTDNHVVQNLFRWKDGKKERKYIRFVELGWMELEEYTEILIYNGIWKNEANK